MAEPMTTPVPDQPERPDDTVDVPADRIQPASGPDNVSRLAAAPPPRYQLRGRIGAGNHGVVFRARDNQLNRDVAIKRFSHFLADDPRAMRRITREVETLARVSHPHVVTVHDLVHLPDGDGEITPHLVMELVEGTSLRALLDSHGPSPRAAVVVQGVLEGLAACHRAGILHLDIKPANVLVTESGGVKIVDFGIARAASDGTATVAGTPHYMAPEQYEGLADVRSDVYSVGCLLYECLTGQAPFEGPMAAQLLSHRTKPRPDPRALAPWVGPGLAAVVTRAMAIDPAERFESVDAMIAALVPVADDVHSTAPPVQAIVSPAEPVEASAQGRSADRAPSAEPVAAPALATVGRMTRLRWFAAGLAVCAFVAAIVPTLVWAASQLVPGTYVPDAWGTDAGIGLWLLSVAVATLVVLGRRHEFFGQLSGRGAVPGDEEHGLAPQAGRAVRITARGALVGSIPLLLPFYAAAVAGLTGLLGQTWPTDVFSSGWGFAWLMMPLAAVFLIARGLALLKPRFGSFLLSVVHLVGGSGAALLFVAYPVVAG
ncbi:hypothetical protein ASD11_07900 [Aeromicrobium sp. Root495]|uniref:serine/threonine-protein kinase n=1 Tax=Aeromicrobium sp. Root495 TaxID=1736550 RepID=UPI00070015CA|nr:serine/threonine-protein kinase [Aeromicrobium sp. Root495]KQY59475.1 hypothetical protein ASD11_07900 [Aeromicrobium sp. Root495]